MDGTEKAKKHIGFDNHRSRGTNAMKQRRLTIDEKEYIEGVLCDLMAYAEHSEHSGDSTAGTICEGYHDLIAITMLAGYAVDALALARTASAIMAGRSESVASAVERIMQRSGSRMVPMDGSLMAILN